MRFSFQQDDDTGTIFRDVMSLLMIAFVILFMIAVVHINPVADPNDADIVPPGSIVVNIFWPDGRNIDIDLWTMGPGDFRPVGYSNRAGRTFNLLRDDLGSVNDDTDMNFENAYSRGAPEGEYIVNVHMYANKDRPPIWPVEVRAVVSISGDAGGKVNSYDIWSGTVELLYQGHEITIVRFRVDADKKVIPESINTIQRNLRTPQ